MPGKRGNLVEWKMLVKLKKTGLKFKRKDEVSRMRSKIFMFVLFSFLFVLIGNRGSYANIARCNPGMNWEDTVISKYYTFTELGISGCSVLDPSGSEAVWNDYCKQHYPTGYTYEYACCLDTWVAAGCYSFKTPTNFKFYYSPKTVPQVSEIRRVYSATGVDHYEQRIPLDGTSNQWGNWQIVAASTCETPCGLDVPLIFAVAGQQNANGITTIDTQMRACGGPHLGESCTPAIEDSITIQPPPPPTYHIRICDESNLNNIEVPIYYNFADLGISGCTDFGETPSYWDDYCKTYYPTGYVYEYACCSDNLKAVGCYSYKVPTDLAFDYLNDGSDNALYTYSATNANHYEVQYSNSSGSTDWHDLGESACEAGCVDPMAGAYESYTIRVRACGGREIGESCTEPIERSYTSATTTNQVNVNLPYQIFLSFATGETGVRLCGASSSVDYNDKYFTFNEINIAQCNDLKGSYYFVWDQQCISANAGTHGCCSDTMQEIRCYDYNTPTGFVFKYQDPEVSVGDSIHYIYHADGANHYEAQYSDASGIWGSWQNLGSASCVNTCSGTQLGSLGIHKTRMRACAGSGLGEVCTEPIESNFTTTPSNTEQNGNEEENPLAEVPSNFAFHFIKKELAEGENAYAFFNADNADHFEMRYYNDINAPQMSSYAFGWTQWFKVTDEDACKTGSGCSFGTFKKGIHHLMIRACGGIGIGESCTALEDSFFVGDSSGDNNPPPDNNVCFSISEHGSDYQALYNYVKPPIKGFKDLFNPNLKTGYEDTHNPGHYILGVGIQLVNGPRIGAMNPGMPSVPSFPKRFKVFLPPGTNSVGITIYYPINTDQGINVRYQQVPDGEYLTYTGSPDGWRNVPWDYEEKAYLKTAKIRDIYTKNSGGHSKALISSATNSSGWVYLQKMPFDSSTIDQVTASVRVDYDTYKEWYNKVKPCTDPNQDLSAGYCWDADGNPVAIMAADCPPAQTPPPTNAPVEINNDYVSLYNYQQSVGYCSKQTCGSESDCTEGASGYPCGSSGGSVDYPYNHKLKLSSFRNLYNLNDEKILCGIDYQGQTPCTKSTKELGLSLTTMTIHAGKYISSFPKQFKIFLPPGTKQSSLTTYIPNMEKLYLIVRYKKAPDGEYFNWNGGIRYEDVPDSLEGSVSLDEMKQRDVFFVNRQGHIFPYSAVLHPPMSVEDSGWLYIKKLGFDSDRIFDLHFSVTVNVSEYLNWYNSVPPLNSDGTCSAQWCWDNDGNPVEAIRS